VLTSRGSLQIELYAQRRTTISVVNHLTPTVAMWAQLHPVLDRDKSSFIIFDIRALWRSRLSVRQSAWMSKITNDALNRSGTGCFIAVDYPYGNSGRQRVSY